MFVIGRKYLDYRSFHIIWLLLSFIEKLRFIFFSGGGLDLIGR